MKLVTNYCKNYPGSIKDSNLMEHKWKNVL